MKIRTWNKINALFGIAVSMAFVFGAFYLVTLETWYGYAGMACCTFWAWGFMRGAKAFANKALAVKDKGQ